MKHWTEPNGVFLIRIPIEWQYRNVAVDGGIEEPPYSFEPYEDPIGCFQVSCYPHSELVPNAAPSPNAADAGALWRHSTLSERGFDAHLFFAKMKDQAIIAKYIYATDKRGDPAIEEQLEIARSVLNSLVVVPEHDRELAASLDKYDRFLSSLVASYDLLYGAIDSESYIQIVIVAANQIDAFLRLSIVLAIQLEQGTDAIDLKYLYQRDREKGLNERTVFQHALNHGVIDQHAYEELCELYESRNRIVHRYIISSIKTVDMIEIVTRYLEMNERTRLVLRDFEDRQIDKPFGIYGRGFARHSDFEDDDRRWAASLANDKHILRRFKRTIGARET